VFIGWPGSAHDSRILRLSSLFDRCENGVLFNVHAYFIIGDSGYPCLPWLITPYKDTGNVTPQQKRFNARFSSSRVIVEIAFGDLKGRWRILRDKVEMRVSSVPDIVLVCCILHNVCIEEKDQSDEFFDGENEDDEDSPAGGGTEQPSGSRRRDGLLHSLGAL
jgi:hypothetical protein